MVGSRIGPYEIQAALGAGGMGEVYRARDSRLGRDVAIKVLPAAWSTDPERLHRFEQEARAAATLNHPNILAVYDIGQHDGTPFIVSELLEGETLRERLEGGALPVRRAVEYGVQIARGLAAAHAKGIVHRDLKPENVFVTSDGQLKILDFGLAKLTQPDVALAGATALPTTPPNTQAGMVLGTAGYMAPEQVRGLVADHRADVFALGVVLYEMLSGRRAFARESAVETMAAILREDAPDLPLTERHIPPALERLVDRCMEKDPAARFHSAGDVGFALEALSTHADSGVLATAATPGSSSRTGRTVLPWAVAAFFIISTAALATLRFTATPPPEPVVQFQLLPPGGGVFPGANNTPRMALSPDGQHLAFTASLLDGSPDRLWIRRLDAIEARPLPGTESPPSAEPTQQPFWSPDGRYIGFFGDYKLRKIDTATGTMQTLAEVPGNNYGGTWNRDGTILVGSSLTRGIHRISANGGVPQQVTTIDESRNEQAHLWPQFLPDGRHFLYLSVGVAAQNRAVYIGSIEPAPAKLLLTSANMASFVPPDRLFFMNGGSLMVQRFDLGALALEGEPQLLAERVQSTANGRPGWTVSMTGVLVYRPSAGTLAVDSELVWYDRSGKPLGTVGEPAAYRGVELSPDNSRVAVHRDASEDRGEIWILDLQRGSTARFTLDASRHNMSPVWSPDGSRIYFSGNVSGAWNLYEKDAAGVGPERVVFAGKDQGAIAPMGVSPDGSRLLFRKYVFGRAGGLSVLMLAGTGGLTPYADQRSNQLWAQVSPDGRWVAYVSSDTGRNEVYVESFPSPGTRYAVATTTGGTQPRWRRDGKELFYLGQAPGFSSGGFTSMMAVGVDAAPPGLKLSLPRPLFDSRAISAVNHGANTVVFQYAVTSDGQRFLVAREGVATSADTNPGRMPLTVVLNWPSLLADR